MMYGTYMKYVLVSAVLKFQQLLLSLESSSTLSTRVGDKFTDQKFDSSFLDVTIVLSLCYATPINDYQKCVDVDSLQKQVETLNLSCVINNTTCDNVLICVV